MLKREQKDYYFQKQNIYAENSLEWINTVRANKKIQQNCQIQGKYIKMKTAPLNKEQKARKYGGKLNISMKHLRNNIIMYINFTEKLKCFKENKKLNT